MEEDFPVSLVPFFLFVFDCNWSPFFRFPDVCCLSPEFNTNASIQLSL